MNQAQRSSLLTLTSALAGAVLGALLLPNQVLPAALFAFGCWMADLILLSGGPEERPAGVD